MSTGWGSWPQASFLPSPLSCWLPFAGGGLLAVTAYVAGTLGTLVGADLSNLGRIAGRGGTHIASIGGAGKFDGVFLPGVIAALIASLIQ
jgi:uncharacterized membrane protein